VKEVMKILKRNYLPSKMALVDPTLSSIGDEMPATLSIKQAMKNQHRVNV
jgi:hypothetical protein